MNISQKLLGPKVLKVVVILLGMAVIPQVVPGSPIGIVNHIPTAAHLDRVEALGVGWIRIDFIWAWVEFERDRFDWAVYDRIVADAEARGIRIFATIAATPEWATSGDEGPGVPSSSEDWREFCYRAAARYRGRIAMWGMWNEPNLDRFWHGSRQDYIELILRPGADAIHEADPDALVGGPELAHLDGEYWDGWLTDCIQAAFEELDVVTHHVYPDGVRAEGVRRKLNEGGDYPWEPSSVRKVLRQAGWYGRPFWLTETGVESDTQGEPLQAIFYEDLLRDWFPAGEPAEWVDGIIFYELLDNPSFPENTFGILGPPPDLDEKLAFGTFQSWLAGAEIDDAAIQAVSFPDVLVPGEPQPMLVSVVNTGPSEWTQSSGYILGIEGLPQQWEITGNRIPPWPVLPGESVLFQLEITPAEQNADLPNIETVISIRMDRSGGLGLGLPRRATLVSGLHPLPEILSHPVSIEADIGRSATFRIVAHAPAELQFQWFRNGLPLADGDGVWGAERPSLRLEHVDQADTGEYWCVVTSGGGWVQSGKAELTLVTPSDEWGPRSPAGRSAGSSKPRPSIDRYFPEPEETVTPSASTIR